MTSSIVLTANAVFLLLGLRKQGKKPLTVRPIGLSCTCLAAAFTLAYGSQLFIGALFEGTDLLSSLPFKMQAAAAVIANSFGVAVVFIIFALIRIQKTPAAAWNMLKNKRR